MLDCWKNSQLRKSFALLLVACGVWLAGNVAVAQLPTATGRQINMSDAAWKLFVPSTYQHRSDGKADLLVHFQGNAQTIWDNALYAELNAVVVTVNYNGLSSAYSGPFSNSTLFQTLVDEALFKTRSLRDFPTDLRWDQLGVSSFSAGYGAVREVLKSANYRDDIDALLAADSLYATTSSDGTPLDSQMVGYKAFADMAQAGEKAFLFSHSEVPTFTYESTKETGDELMQHLGIAASRVNSEGLGTLQFNRHAESGGFRLWGARGADGDSHLAHLRYIGEFFAELPLAKLCVSPADFNADDAVNGLDYLQWQRDRSLGTLDDWQTDYAIPASAIISVPEPASAVLLLVTALTMASSRRRATSANL